MRSLVRTLLLTGLVTLINYLPTVAQRNLYFQDTYALYRQAEELYALQQYAAAESAFAEVQKRERPTGQDDIYQYQVNAAYYQAVCALELYNPDAEMMLQQFSQDYPEHPKQQLAYYQLGRYHFREKQYRDALDWFSKVQPGDLDPEERMDYAFQLGYCYFNRKLLDEAKPLFAQVREGDSEYYYPANYYYGYIALADGEYDQAMLAFEVAAISQTYEKVVPYYIAQVHFARGNYQETIDYASPLIGDRKIQYDVELHQLIGQSWYALGEHDKALPYLQYYVDKARKLRPEDYFQLGVAQYRSGLYEEAISNFSQLNTAPDSLAQQALYLSGDALIKLGNREGARSAFQEAARLEANPDISREASFLYAKLSYELDYQSVALEAFRDYLNKYPSADRSAEAQLLLANALLRSRDYAQAIQVLEAIPNLGSDLKAAFQKAAFFRGVELFNDQLLEQASQFFSLSRKYPSDLALDAAAIYWLGETSYRQKKYSESIRLLSDFTQKTGLPKDLPGNASKPAAYYTLGYATLEQEKYSVASGHFRKVLDNWKTSSTDKSQRQMASDATLRLGDCHFMLKDYSKADREYKNISDARLPGSDYAIFQRGLIQGLQGNFQQKTTILQTLITGYPESVYVDDALYESGNTYLVMGNSVSAQRSFDQLLTRYPNGPFSARALLKQGLLAYNDKDYDRALTYYQQVAKDYKGSPEGREALAGIRDVSIETSRPEIYTAMAGVGVAERDSVTWNSAYQRYLTGDCNGALPGFNRYLDDFPNGFFAASAHFYRGECRYGSEAYREALPDYEYVLNQRHSRFTETALLKAARIAFFDVKDFEKAANWYGELYVGAEYKGNSYEALKGLVRAHNSLGNFTEVIRYGTEWSSASEASAEEIVEANFLIAKSYQALSRDNEAYNLYGQVARASTNLFGTEARFERAKLEYNRGEYEKAKNTCLDLIQHSAYEEWTIRGYLLVADVLREQGEFVQARAALSSIIDGYTGDEALLKAARQKLIEIEAIERSRSRLDQGDETDFFELDPALPSEQDSKNP